MEAPLGESALGHSLLPLLGLGIWGTLTTDVEIGESEGFRRAWAGRVGGVPTSLDRRHGEGLHHGAWADESERFRRAGSATWGKPTPGSLG